MKISEKNSKPAGQANMAITKSGLWLLLAGLIVLVAGYVLMTGGGTTDPQKFSYAMFDFRRLVAAPIVCIAGIVVEIVAIMRVVKPKGEK